MMRKITWKFTICLLIASIVFMPVLAGCDKPEDEPVTTVDDETTEVATEITTEMTTDSHTEASTELDMSMYSEGLEFTSDGGGTCHVSGLGTCKDKDVAIPPISPEGDRVTEIGLQAFSGCSGLTGITIPDSVSIIGMQAFAGCSGLTSLTLPDSVRIIKEQALAGCSGLTSITVQEGNPVYHSDGNCLIATASKVLVHGCVNSMIPTDGSVTTIGAYAFYGCHGLTSITIPANVTSIGEYAFAECSGITSIAVQEGNPVYHSFGNCVIETAKKVLVLGCQNSEIPTDGSVTGIGAYAFFGCSGLTSVTIPAGVAKIGTGAFVGCSGLTSIAVQDGNSKFYSAGNCLIENASKGVILGCKNSVIPADGSIKRIRHSAFSGCSDLTGITIPDSVGVIEDYAFRNCSGMTSITIPDSVTSIQLQVFSGCDQLIQEENGVHYVDRWVIDCDKDVESITLRADTVGIGNYAFYDCHVTSVKMPDTVVRIGESAFSNCQRLASITMSNNVTSIGEHAFDYCIELTNIFIADSVTSIGYKAFYKCTNLTSLTIPAGGVTIGHEAFYGCSGLTSVTIPSNMRGVDESVFDGCFRVTDVYYDGTMEQWKEYFVGFKNATIHCVDGDITPEQ